MSEYSLEPIAGFRPGQKFVAIDPFTPQERWVPVDETPAAPFDLFSVNLRITHIDCERKVITFAVDPVETEKCARESEPPETPQCAREK